MHNMDETMDDTESPTLPISPTLLIPREVTPDELADIVSDMYMGSDHPTVGAIADKLQLGYSVVYRALKSRDVKLRKTGPKKVGFRAGSKSDQVAKLLVTNRFVAREERMKQAAIAKQVGCTRELVVQVAEKLRAKGRKRYERKQD